MDLHLRGKTALVTGASAGIGRGIALALAAEGVRLAVTTARQQAGRTRRRRGGRRRHAAAAQHAGEAAWAEAMTLNFERPRQLGEALIDAMIAQGWGR